MSLTATRTVQRLRLRGSGEEEVRRTAHRVEDALRVASLRDPAGRVVVVRQVVLSPLEAGSSSQSIALEIERAVERALVTAVHGAEPGAAAAPVVWFTDRLDAHVAAAGRLLSGGRLEEWFWTLAIPALAGPGPPLRALFLSLAELEAAPAALPAFVAGVARAGGASGLRRLGTELDDVDVSVVARAAGIGNADTLALIPPQESGVAAPARVSRARALLMRLCVTGGEGGAVARWGWPGEEAIVAPTLFGIDAGLRPAETNRQAVPRRGEEPTEAAGLLFLLPVLAHLGFGEWAEVHPDWGAWCLAGRVLRIWADRVDVPAEDPIRSVLPGPMGELDEAPMTWEAPEAFREVIRGEGEIRRTVDGLRLRWDRSSALLLGFSPDGEAPSRPGSRHGDRAEAVAGAWAVAARRWLRRRAGIGVVHLVRRGGRVAVSPTHVDVTLPLSAVDLRIRRAGLDLDPGWLPWFRRVVRFHYDAGTRDEPLRGTVP